MLNLFDGESDTPELIWDSSMRAELRRVIAEQLDICIAKRRESGIGNEGFTLETGVGVKYTKLESELFVGGVYVSRFLKEPTYNVRDLTAFLEMLLQTWTHELQLCTTHESTSMDKESSELILGGPDALQQVTNASVYLCKVRTNLCDKLSQWGYMGRCLSFLESTLTRELLGTPLLSVMRLLHVAVGRRPNVEALIVSGQNDQMHGIVTFTMQAVGTERLHPDAAFMVEMLKKLFADALGDLKSVPKMTNQTQTPTMAQAPAAPQLHHTQVFPQGYAMAPSPAPGEGPVNRNRVFDDPLAMPPAPIPTNNGPVGYGSQPTQTAGQGFQPSQPGMGAPSMTSYNQPSAGTFGMQAPVANYGSYNQGSTFGGYGHGNQPIMGGSQLSQGYSTPASATPVNRQFQQPQSQPSSIYGTQSSFGAGGTPAQGYQSNVQAHSSTQPQHSMSGSSSQYQTTHRPQQPGMTAYPQTPSQYTPGNMYNAPAQSSAPHSNSFAYSNQATQSQFLQQNSSGQYNQQQQTVSQQQQAPATPQYAQQTNVQQPYYNQGQNTASWQTQTPQPTVTPQVQRTQQNQGPAYRNINQATQQLNQTTPQPALHNSSGQTPLPPQHGAGQPQPNQQQWQNSTQMQTPQVQTVQPGQPATGNQMQPQWNQYQPAGSTTNAAFVAAPNVGQQPQMQAPPQAGQPPDVQTVQEEPQVTEGAGIDARKKEDPKEEAEKKTQTLSGAPGAADGRVALLQSALTCDLPEFLVESVLESSTLSKVKDSAALKVHSVELLKLLISDPGYGMKFQLILDQIPAWEKYKSQDHSLFITGPEQKADYFLTDGGSGERKLLTQG